MLRPLAMAEWLVIILGFALLATGPLVMLEGLRKPASAGAK